MTRGHSFHPVIISRQRSLFRQYSIWARTVVNSSRVNFTKSTLALLLYITDNLTQVSFDAFDSWLPNSTIVWCMLRNKFPLNVLCGAKLWNNILYFLQFQKLCKFSELVCYANKLEPYSFHIKLCLPWWAMKHLKEAMKVSVLTCRSDTNSRCAVFTNWDTNIQIYV